MEGVALLAGTDITAPANFLISRTSGGPYTSTVNIPLAQANGTNTIYVVLAGGLAINTYSGNVTMTNLTAGLAAPPSVAVSGEVTAASNVCLTDNFNSGYGNWSGTGTYQNSTAGLTGNGTGFNSTNDNIVTTTTITNPASISFQLARTSSTANKTFSVQYSTSSSGPWTVAQDILVGSVTTSHQLFTIPLNLTGDYYLRLVMSQRSGGSYYLDDVEVSCGAAPVIPEILVEGNATEIVDGDNTPSTTDDTDFGSLAVAGGSDVHTFTIKNTGTGDLTLTSVSSSNNSEFAIGGATSGTITSGNDVTFTVTFDPSAIGTRTSTITIVSDDADEGTYTFDVEGEGVNSNLSDIIENNTFTYPQNIDYTTHQAATITSTANSRAVFKFDIRDGGAAANDADVLGTELTAIEFTVDKLANIRTAALFDGNALVNATPVIAGGKISFSGLSVSAGDDATKSLTLRVTFNAAVTDNDKMIFTITSATANSSGSVFSAADAGGAVSDNNAGNDNNRIEVTATKLAFGQQPSNASVNVAMTPAVTVGGYDANDNLDLDFIDNISITSTGTLTGSPVSVSAVNGVATFSGLTHTVAGTGFTLTADHATFTDVVSSTFDVVTFTFLVGDFRPLYATDFSYNGDWEYYDGSSWGVVPDGKAPENTSTTVTRILIDEYVTGGGNTTTNYDCDILIQNGGTLVLNDDDNPPVAAEFLSANNTLEVESGGELLVQGDIDLPATANLIVRDGGKMTINYSNMDNVHPMWDGVEKFEGGSLLEINDWDWTASPQVRSLINVSTAISDNDNGYKFGKVYFNPTNLTDNWTIVGSSLNVNVAENDFEINNTSNFYVLGMTNKTSGISSTYGEDIIVHDGNFTFGASFSSDNFDQTFNIAGDVIINNDDNFYIHHAFNGTPTIATGDGQVKIGGNLEVWDLTSSFTSDVTTKEVVFTGDKNHTIEVSPNVSNVPFIIEGGDSAILLKEDLKFSGNSSIEIEDDAIFNFGFDAIGTTALEVQDVSGSSNEFLQRGGAYLYITHPQGIWDASANGNVEDFSASNTVYSQSQSTYHYIGKANQETGDAYTSGSTSKTIICELNNNTLELTVTERTGTSAELDIRKGIVVNTDANHIYGSGDLTISDGGLRTNVLTPTGVNKAPLLDGSYSLTGGFVELNALGDQTLRGGEDYYDLIISGSNTTGVDDKTPTSAFTIANKLTITGTPIFDISNNGMTGAAGITQDGGLLRISRASTTVPQLDGTATAYALTGGTIELYGTGAAQSHNLRGTDGNSATISYHNVEVNADAANIATYNVGLSAGIELTGTMNINSPAVFQMDETDHIDGTGVFNVGAGSTYKYGDEHGITLGTSTVTTAGAIRLSTARVAANFSTDASYGFVSNGAMVTGDALPSEMVNMYLDKGTAGDKVTLTNDAEVKNVLNFVSNGIVKTDAHTLFVSDNANTAIVNANTAGLDKYVEGRLQWTTATGITYAFPVGHSSEGAQGFNFTPNTGAGNILAYMEPNNTDPIYDYAYCDLETPNGGSGEIGTGLGTSDGVLDQIEFDEESPLQWDVTNPSGGAITNYDIEVLANGDQDISVVSSTNAGTAIRYLLKDGAVYNGSSVAATTNGAPAFNTTGYEACPNQYTLTGMTSFSHFTLNGASQSNTALPVELLAFDAKANGDIVEIIWATASELNNDFFTIERSADGINFEKISIISGAGNSNIVLNYTDIDENPLSGISYYRLKQTDFDGSYEYSHIVAVKFDSKEVFDVLGVYPNPTRDILNIDVIAFEAVNMSVTIMDMMGRVVSVKEVETYSGTYTVDVQHLANGAYTLSILSQGKVINKRFVKN